MPHPLRPRSFFPPIEVTAWRRALHLAAFVVLGLYAVWANRPQDRPITIDNQLYYYVAERVAAGVPPHVSLVDHKHALSSMISGAAMALGRLVGADDVMSVRAVSIAFGLLVAPALWIAAYELTLNAVVAHLAAAIMLAFHDYFAQVAMGVRPQVFMTAFLALAFAALARERFALCGALAVAAFLCWQPALLIFGAILAALALRGSPWRPLARCAAGGVAMFLAYEAYFVAHGALGEQLRQSFAMAGDLAGFHMPSIGESLQFVLRGGSWGKRWWVVLPALYLAFLVALAVEAYTRPREVFVTARRESLATALWLAAFATLAFTFVDHQAYPDRYFIQPFVALANAVVVGWALCAATRRLEVSETGKTRLSGVVFVLALVATAATVSPVAVGRNAGLASQRLTAKRTLAIRERYGSLWAIGCPHLLALERTQNYDPVGIVIDKRVREYVTRDRDDGVYRPQGGRMPGVILTARHGIRPTIPWLASEYRKVSDAPLNRQGVQVWVRQDCLSSAPCADALACPTTPACGGHPAAPAGPPARKR